MEMFGYDLPWIVGKRVGAWRWTSGVHTFLAQIVLPALVSLHIAAALYHRFVRNDGMLVERI